MKNKDIKNVLAQIGETVQEIFESNGESPGVFIYVWGLKSTAAGHCICNRPGQETGTVLFQYLQQTGTLPVLGRN